MELRIDNQLDEKTEITIRTIIGAAIDVHRELGPGYLEKVYEQAMALELRHRGLAYATQVSVAVHYKGEKIHGQILAWFKLWQNWVTKGDQIPAHI